MNFLHVAIIEDFEECLISRTEEGLREQVVDFLKKNNIKPPTDEEWLVCVVAKEDREIPIDTYAVGLITYYKAEEKL